MNIKKPFQLDGRSAMITGGGSGIGKAVALLFAQQGAYVHIIDRHPDSCHACSVEILKSGGMVNAWVADVTKRNEVTDIVDRIDSIDILVNCAGISHIGKAHDTSEADFDRVFHVNVKGIHNMLLAVLPHMMERKSGIILNLASIANHVGLSERFAYSMSKGAVQSMTLSVARDYLKDGIRCNSISPARVHTPFVDGFIRQHYPGREDEIFRKLSSSQPIGRMALPAEVAHLALYLCSDEAAFITGCDYPIDGGFIRLNN